MAPGVTTNPHNPAHTPGGSSSGSAAAVADHMVHAALGTQTGGSVLRPSSYCGIFGFKPTYNTFNKMGVWPAAESIDTIGVHARSLDDIELLTAVLRMQTPAAAAQNGSARRGSACAGPKSGTMPSRKPKPRSKAPPPRSVRPAPPCRTSNCPMRSKECTVVARGTINFVERAACMAFLWDNRREALSPQMRRYVEGGAKDHARGICRSFPPAR